MTTNSTQHAALLHPPAELAGCLFAGIWRDTRGLRLNDAERMNYFPASPLVALNIVIYGETRLVPVQADPAARQSARALPPVTLAGPQSRPLTSWAPGPVTALAVGIYPEAYLRLTGQSAHGITDQVIAEVPDPLFRIAQSVRDAASPERAWQALCNALVPLWQGGEAAKPKAHYLADWARGTIIRAALSGPGQSLRAAERRLKRWTGQTRQTLSFFADFEDLHRISRAEPDGNLAQIAHDAGYADQSHMGRSVRRATGFSPAKLNHLIATHEAFWCYRLLGERF
jgi:AraC-like DNA-binding protein